MSHAAGGAPASDIDLWSVPNLREPFEAYSELRALGPVVWLERAGVHAVTRFNEVRAVLQDWETFSSAKGVMIADEVNATSGRGIITTDPPVHDTRRRVLNAQLVATALTPHEEFVAGQASDLVEEVVARGTVDVVKEVGERFSTEVVGELVGLPREGRDRLIHLANEGFDLWGPAGERVDGAWPGFRALHEYGHRVADDGLLEPGRWGSQIFEAGDRGDVEPEACHGVLFAYLQAGMDTTSAAISSAILLFGRHPESWEQLRADRSLVRSAINEVVRYYSPVQRYTRLATRPTVLAGVEIPAGGRVLVLIGSANRDDSRFERADDFDVTRDPRNHLGFGRGVHHCAGASLAKLEMTALFDALADRVERLEVVDHRWADIAALLALESLTVELVAAA